MHWSQSENMDKHFIKNCNHLKNATLDFVVIFRESKYLIITQQLRSTQLSQMHLVLVHLVGLWPFHHKQCTICQQCQEQLPLQHLKVLLPIPCASISVYSPRWISIYNPWNPHFLGTSYGTEFTFLEKTNQKKSKVNLLFAIYDVNFPPR